MNDPIRTMSNATVAARDVASVFHSWSAQGSLAPLPIAGALGSRVWDHEGTEYIDMSSQLVNVNIGHQHPDVIAGIEQQLRQLATLAPAHASDVRARAAEAILRHAPANMDKVFFTNGGADANENAIRMARLHTGRDKVISRYRSYHGNTGAAIAATGDWRRIPNDYSRGHIHAFGPYLYRSDFWATTPEEESMRAVQHLRRVIESEGPRTIAAILLETIPGTAGVLTPPPGYLAGVRALCDEHGIVLILDEVMAGFARAGAWFALDDEDVVPDLVTFAKGVNSGYVPVGGVLVSKPISERFDAQVFPGGLTYSGHPLAAASIVASIETFERDDIVGNARRIGSDIIAPALSRIALESKVVGEVRGRGVFWAIELVSDRKSRAPLGTAAMTNVKQALLARGVLPFIADNRIHVVPPATIDDATAREGLDVVADVLASV